MENATRYIKAGWLIDGSGNSIQKNILLTLQHGVILDISVFRENDHPEPSLITDYSHCCILPPLIDSHVHLALSSSTDPLCRKKQLQIAYKERRLLIEDHIAACRAHGVLAVRDGGDQFAHVLRHTQEKRERYGNDVLIRAASRALYRQGRYGSFLGKAVAEGESPAEAATGEMDSATHIKLINSGMNSLTEYGRTSPPQFTCTEITELRRLLLQRGKKLMVHANGRLPVREAVEAGCHSIEHGFFMGAENLKRMAEQQTFWVPTAVTMQKMLDSGAGNRDVIRRIIDKQMEYMEKGRKYGVSMAVGTDAGSSGIEHGKTVAEELQLFVESGCSLAEAIQCASTNAAKLLAIEEAVGPLTRGRPAHFIAVRSSPSTLLNNLADIETISFSP